MWPNCSPRKRSKWASVWFSMARYEKETLLPDVSKLCKRHNKTQVTQPASPNYGTPSSWWARSTTSLTGDWSIAILARKFAGAANYAAQTVMAHLLWLRDHQALGHRIVGWGWSIGMHCWQTAICVADQIFVKGLAINHAKSVCVPWWILLWWAIFVRQIN